MIDPKFFDDIAQRLNNSVPAGMRVLQQDVDRNLRAAVQAALSRLDLVTREEFEVQAKVLARTRAKLDAMTQQVATLEEKVLGKKTAAGPTYDSTPENLDNDQDMDGG